MFATDRVIASVIESFEAGAVIVEHSDGSYTTYGRDPGDTVHVVVREFYDEDQD